MADKKKADKQSKAKPDAKKTKPKAASKNNKKDTLTREQKIEQTTADNKARLLSALSEHGGNVSKACSATGLVRSTHYAYMTDDPDYAKAVDEVYESLVDEAEETIKQLMRFSEVDKVRLDAAKEICKARGKKRGYGVEKRESELSGSVNVNATVQDVRFELPENGTGNGSNSPLPPDWETATSGG